MAIDDLAKAGMLSASLGTTPWAPVRTYDAQLQYAGKHYSTRVEIVHHADKGLEGALGVVRKNGSVTVGPSLLYVSEEAVANLLVYAVEDSSKGDVSPRARHLQRQNAPFVKEVYDVLSEYRWNIAKKNQTPTAIN